MKFKLMTVFLAIIVAMIILSGIKSKIIAQEYLKLQLPFNDIYRITSYVDHQTPFNQVDNLIFMFNGTQYNNCPSSVDQWNDRGPYCYDGHEGIDWATPENTPVLAATYGEVILAGLDPNYGITIVISHENSYLTRYAHLITRTVSVGNQVKTGDLIGYSGNTGASSGPHLHFNVRHNGFITDPFGWRGNSTDPLITYSGETAVCLWANEWCNETIVEDGSVVKFAEFGNDWSPTNWRSQGNSWTMKYLPNGDGSSSGYWIPYLNPSGLYEVFAFIPAVFTNTTTVTYTIHDKDTEHLRVVDQSAYPNQWVSLGSYHFGHRANNYIKLTNKTAGTIGTKRIVFDTIKFRQYLLLLPAMLKNYHPDSYEPNDDFASAFGITPDEAYLSYIWGMNDEDWFKSWVVVPVGRERLITLDLKDIPAGTNYDLALYDETGIVILNQL